MVKLTEDMIVARTRVSEMSNVRKLSCWGSNLDDISVLRRLNNVEMIALSLNGIESLSDFQHCQNLQELFLRGNRICSLREILYLKDLRQLKNLWLAENPCADGSERYRQTVIHNLPQLEKLDNISISSQERAEALRYGEAIEDVEVESVCSPDERFSVEELEDLRSEGDEGRRQSQSHYVENYRGYLDDNYNSYDRESVKSNAVCRAESVSSQSMMRRAEMRPEFNHQTPDYSYQRRSALEDTMSISSEYPSRCQALYNTTTTTKTSGRGLQFQPRPDLGRLPRARNRNSNILSSILCLIKEIDGPSLEVVEMAVRCRMEELED